MEEAGELRFGQSDLHTKLHLSQKKLHRETTFTNVLMGNKMLRPRHLRENSSVSPTFV